MSDSDSLAKDKIDATLTKLNFNYVKSWKDLDHKCERKIRDKVADKVLDKWERVGRDLGVSDKKLKIVGNHGRVEDKAVALLDGWSEESFSSESTCLALGKVLLNLNLKDAFQTLCEAVNQEKIDAAALTSGQTQQRGGSGTDAPAPDTQRSTGDQRRVESETKTPPTASGETMNTLPVGSHNLETPTSTPQATTMEGTPTQESQLSGEYARKQNLEDISVPSQSDLNTSSSMKQSQSAAKHYQVSLKPRKYQLELAQPGINGNNYIVVAPTNSGKTLVAALVIANHLEKKSVEKKPPKVVVVVKTRTLADQQAEQLSKYIPKAAVECRTGNRVYSPISKPQLHIRDALCCSDIVVCTAGKLLDELKKEMVAFQEISLIIVDECHNTERKSNYAQIMQKYLEQKATKCQLPQVVGLTATPGMGTNPSLNPIRAVDNITTLCAYMDAKDGIQTVQENIDELNEFVTKPKDYLDPVNQSKQREEFIHRLEKEMVECELSLSITSSPRPRWSQQYLQMVKEKKAAVEESSDRDDRNNVSTVRLLECYAQTLVNYVDLPRDQVMEAIENYDDLTPSASHVLTDHEKCLLERFERLKEDLSQMQKYENPILEKLEKRLTDAFERNSNTAGILFVRTREQAEAVSNWISESSFAELVGINSEMLIGHSIRGTGLYMSDDNQKRVVEQFRENECNILVATSVAEEGLDIKQCNLVMRLHISSAKSKAQMRGRARAEDSEIITIISDDPKKMYKDMLNDELLILMKHLIQNNCLPSADELSQTIARKQELILEKVKNERELAKSRVNSHPAKDVELKCTKCKTVVCRGSDIYVIDKTNHHVVLNPDFAALYELVKHNNPGPLLGCDEPLIEKKYKFHCMECNASWGALGIPVSPNLGVELPILSCTSFMFIVNGRRKPVRQWKERPFNVSPFSEWLANNKANDVTDSEQDIRPQGRNQQCNDDVSDTTKAGPSGTK